MGKGKGIERESKSSNLAVPVPLQVLCLQMARKQVTCAKQMPTTTKPSVSSGRPHVTLILRTLSQGGKSESMSCTEDVLSIQLGL